MVRLSFGSRWVNLVLMVGDSTKEEDDEPKEYVDNTGGSFGIAPTPEFEISEPDESRFDPDDMYFGFTDNRRA